MAVEVGFGTSKIIREDHIFPIPLIQFTHPILKKIKIKNDQLYSKSGKEQKIIKKQDYQTILNEDATHLSLQWGLNTMLSIAF